MGAAHLYTVDLLKQVAVDELDIKGKDLCGKPFNQLKNYVWAQFGQITLYEVLAREGADAARKVVNRLVARG